MGVHGLWELLAPVGRRVSVETLAGKRLAIDASIWMVQFLKAMRDEKGEIVRNAHLLGFFRRICKLLYLRTKPVFVFDGGTPTLKRRTVIARRRQRENAQAKIRKTAEKLLLNHLKAMKLKELAEDLENQKKKNAAKGRKAITSETGSVQKSSEKQVNELDDNLVGQRNDVEAKDKQVISDDPELGHNKPGETCNQEALDEILAASLAAEEDSRVIADASASGTGFPDEEEDEDEDEEMILPEMQGKVDPAVLAALPPSMQLDLLGQMREGLMAENRQKYQKVKKEPSRFSELQIQSYLKTIAFRREIDQVQKSAAGKGIGGVQTSRIASEANREFIFSTSFSGDKQVLMSSGEDRSSNDHNETSKENNVGDSKTMNISTVITGSAVEEPQGLQHDDVDTYLDERGRFRVSRVRALGIRMTRDIQRNLDLMKEIDQERVDKNENVGNDFMNSRDTFDVDGDATGRNPLQHTSNEGHSLVDINNDKMGESILKNGSSIEVSFEDNSEQKGEEEDDIFARLAAGNPVVDFSKSSLPENQSPNSDSDIEWEQGLFEEKCNLNHVNGRESRSYLAADDVNNDSEVDWEEGSPDIQEKALFPPGECSKNVSRGAQEEEADFQEAIRRSLVDLTDQKFINESFKDNKYSETVKMISKVKNAEPIDEVKDDPEPEVQVTDTLPSDLSSCDVGVDSLNIPRTNVSFEAQLKPLLGVEPSETGRLIDEASPSCDVGVDAQNISRTNDSFEAQLKPLLGVDPSETEMLIDKASGINPNYELLMHEQREMGGLHEKGAIAPAHHAEEKAVRTSEGEPVDSFVQKNGKAALADYLVEKVEQGKTHLEEPVPDINTARNLEVEEVHDDCLMERDAVLQNSTTVDGSNELYEATMASLEKEMLKLSEERKGLGDEQRRLERNAESVNGELFAECQELLQMFGLPYIIAPMEAEAQCAYMEVANLVDGVVTDDSDVFLFGARSVYKNIFDDRKYVETYFMKDMESELGLNREKLIRMAMLLGSDYTEGISGIGIVNAIEVVNAFPEEDGLQKFREWVESPDPAILGKYDVQSGSNSKRKVMKNSESSINSSNNDAQGVSATDSKVDDNDCMKQIFMDKHRNVSKNWHIPSSFPSGAVISAYTVPHVDKSTEPFAWGKPDVFVLRKLCWEKFGWGSQKADEMLVPVLKEYEKHENQLRLEAFYTFNERFAKIRSKRIKKAVKGMTRDKSVELMDASMLDISASKKKRKASPSDAEGENIEQTLDLLSSGAEDVGKSAEGTTAKHSREKRIKDGANLEKSIGMKRASMGPKVRGKDRGRNRGSSARKGRKVTSSSILAVDDTISEGEQLSEIKKHEESSQIRRSQRPRKAVTYSMNDSESDDLEKVDLGNENSADEDVKQQEAFEDGSAGSGQFGEVGTEPGTSTGHSSCIGDGVLTGPGDDPLTEADAAEDYLKMGGGFCLDDDENEGLDRSASIPRGKVIVENSDLSDFRGDENHEVHHVDLVSDPIRVGEDHSESRTGASTNKVNLEGGTERDCPELVIHHENTDAGDSRTSPVGSLRAMPNLRRKRRKS